MHRSSKLRFAALIMLAVALTLGACKKDQREEAQATPPAVKEAPADVLAIASLPDGLQLTQLKAVLGAIDPNAAQGVNMLSAQAGPALASMLGEVKLDDKAPLQVLLLNPKKHPAMPVVLVGTLSGKSAGDIELRTIGKVSAAGNKAALDAVADFVPSLGEAKELRVVMLPKHAIDVYRQEIESLPQMMAMMGGTDSLGPILQMYVRFILALGDNADSVELLTDHGEGRGTFRLLVRARKDSTLAKFVGAQSANDFEFVNRLPSNKSIVIDSNIVAGPVKSAFLDVTEEFLQAFRGISDDKKAAYTENLKRLADLMTGRLAGAMEFKADAGVVPTMEGAFLAGLTGEGDGKAALDGMFEAWAGGTSVEIAGTKQTMHFERDAGEHQGVKFSKQTSKVEMPSLATSYEQTSFFTVLDNKDMLMVIGDENTMKGAIDNLRAGGKSSPTPSVQKLVDLAKKRKASALMTMDMGPMMGAIAAAAKIPLIGFTVQFAGGTMEMDVDIFRVQ